jgi:hypothetical protein
MRFRPPGSPCWRTALPEDRKRLADRADEQFQNHLRMGRPIRFRRQTGPIEGRACRRASRRPEAAPASDRAGRLRSQPPAEPLLTRLTAAPRFETRPVLPRHARAQNHENTRQRRPIRGAAAHLPASRARVAAAARPPPSDGPVQERPCSHDPPIQVRLKLLTSVAYLTRHPLSANRNQRTVSCVASSGL